MKKVLGLVISHRKLGNSEIMVKEIMKHVPGDCSRELIRLTDLKIEPCRACYKCLQPGQDCPLKDDFNFVISTIQSADALIIGVPVYILGPHGYYKMLMDRLVGAAHYSPSTQGKPCVIVTPYGSQGWQGYSQAAAPILPLLLQMKIVGNWQIHATLPGESIMNPDNMDYARNLGQTLFAARAYQPGPRECSRCGSDLLRLLPGNRVECPICGSQGIIRDNNLPDFTAADDYRFSAPALEEHFQGWLSAMKHRYWDEKERLHQLQKGYRDLDWWIKP